MCHANPLGKPYNELEVRGAIENALAKISTPGKVPGELIMHQNNSIPQKVSYSLIILIIIISIIFKFNNCIKKICSTVLERVRTF